MSNKNNVQPKWKYRETQIEYEVKACNLYYGNDLWKLIPKNVLKNVACRRVMFTYLVL